MLDHIGNSAPDDAGNHERYHKVSEGIERASYAPAEIRQHLPGRKKTKRHATAIGLDVQKTYGDEIWMHCLNL
jgi:hypothetical protein